ncbi:MAG: stage II sporulation protein M [Acidimicrobiia bacterium]
MNPDSFARARGPAWTELDELVRQRNLDAAGTRRLAASYRAAAADLAYAQRAFPDASFVADLAANVGKARWRVYRWSRPRRFLSAFVGFLTRDYWRAVRHRPLFLLIAAVMFFGPFIGSAVWAQYEPAKARGLAPDGVESVVERPSADFGLTVDEKAATSAQIYTNNIKIAFMEWAGGLTAGIATAYLLLSQGFALGAMFGLTIKAGNGDVLWGFVLPHGFLELSCLVVIGAAGLRWGWSLIDPGTKTRAQAFAEEGRRSVVVALGTGLALFFCGIVEGMVSTSGLQPAVGLAVGLTLGGALWLGIALLGCGSDQGEELVPATTVLSSADA